MPITVFSMEEDNSPTSFNTGWYEKTRIKKRTQPNVLVGMVIQDLETYITQIADQADQLENNGDQEGVAQLDALINNIKYVRAVMLYIQKAGNKPDEEVLAALKGLRIQVERSLEYFENLDAMPLMKNNLITILQDLYQALENEILAKRDFDGR